MRADLVLLRAQIALRLLRPTPWVRRWGAPALGTALAFLILLVGGRVPNEFIYFQF